MGRKLDKAEDLKAGPGQAGGLVFLPETFPQEKLKDLNTERSNGQLDNGNLIPFYAIWVQFI